MRGFFVRERHHIHAHHGHRCLPIFFTRFPPFLSPLLLTFPLSTALSMVTFATRRRSRSSPLPTWCLCCCGDGGWSGRRGGWDGGYEECKKWHDLNSWYRRYVSRRPKRDKEGGRLAVGTLLSAFHTGSGALRESDWKKKRSAGNVGESARCFT